MKIKAKWIFFDIGGVILIDRDPNWFVKNYIEILQSFGLARVTEKEVLLAVTRASAKNGSLNKNLFLEFLDDSPAKEAHFKLRNARKEAEKGGVNFYDPQAEKILRKLSADYKLGIMANQPTWRKLEMGKEGLLKYFTHKGMSEDYGISKPNPKLFEKILEEAKAEPTHSVMIDDNIERGLLPAKKLGMTTVWMDKTKRPPLPDSGVDHRIKKLPELLNLFKFSQ